MADVIIAALAGMFGWSLLEYLLHRFLGHEPRTRPNPFATEHVRHHIEGDYFAPNWKKGLSAVIVVALLVGPGVALAGVAPGVAFALGFAATYVGYEVIHRRNHTHPGRGPYGRWARRHHFHHHFGNPRSNHGVTTPLWDWVFGTHETAGVVRVPRKLAMVWLIDPSTQQVRAEHAARYTLGHERGAATP